MGIPKNLKDDVGPVGWAQVSDCSTLVDFWWMSRRKLPRKPKLVGRGDPERFGRNLNWNDDI